MIFQGHLHKTSLYMITKPSNKLYCSLYGGYFFTRCRHTQLINSEGDLQQRCSVVNIVHEPQTFFLFDCMDQLSVQEQLLNRGHLDRCRRWVNEDFTLKNALIAVHVSLDWLSFSTTKSKSTYKFDVSLTFSERKYQKWDSLSSPTPLTISTPSCLINSTPRAWSLLHSKTSTIAINRCWRHQLMTIAASQSNHWN